MSLDENRMIRERTAGHKAQALWDDKTLQECFTEIADDIRNGWSESKSEEADRREELYYLNRALEELKRRIRKRIGVGNTAAKQLTEIEEGRKRR